MNQNILSCLGCSGSLAVLLLVGNAANAAPLPQQISNSASIAENAENATPQSNLRYASIDPDSDTVGDLAIAQFKCDCPACRIAIVQMLQAGQLSL
jgi:hypothetical protein